MSRIVLGLTATLALCGLIATAADRASAGPACCEKGAWPKVGMRLGERLGLNLTEEQKARIKEILQAAREKAVGVLTDEQQAMIAEAREKLAGRVKEMRPNLSDDQKARIKELLQAARQKARNAQSVEERKQIVQDALAEAGKLLTDEQAGKVKALREKLGGWKAMIQRWRDKHIPGEITAPAD